MKNLNSSNLIARCCKNIINEIKTTLDKYQKKDEDKLRIIRKWSYALGCNPSIIEKIIMTKTY
jgi:hypothetical protein